MNDQNKRKKTLELAMSFWAGVGLMSIINVWKISQSMHAETYSWIMFGVAVLFVVICFIYIISINQQSKKKPQIVTYDKTALADSWGLL